MFNRTKTLILLLFWSNVFGEDDFGFEEEKNLPLQRLWGIPDATAHVGYLFSFQVPENAFEGNIVRYKAFSGTNGPLPNWLNFNEKLGIIEGVPTKEDLGEHYITIKAFDQNLRDSVKDVFAVEVLSSTTTSNSYIKELCKSQEDKTFFSIILDQTFEDILPKERVLILKNLIGFFGINADMIKIVKLNEKDDMLSDSLLAAGPGNIKKKNSKTSTLLQWQVGCQGNIWVNCRTKVERARVGAKDGTLSEVIQHPIIGWRLSKDDYEFRRRRQVHLGSGETNIDDDEDEDINQPEQRIVVVNTATPTFSPDVSSTVFQFTIATHPHRHHHGDSSPTSYTVPIGTIMPTPTYIPERPLSTFEDVNVHTVSTPLVSSPVHSSILMELGTPDGKEEWISVYHSSSDVTTPSIPTTTQFSTTEEEVTNSPPSITHRLEKIPITAGKLKKYLVPIDTFSDLEDGSTRNLNLTLTDGDGLPPWIQFDRKNQEIVALPLENQVSKWTFTVIAMDSGGLSQQDTVEVLVQHHKAIRTFNHEFMVEVTAIPSGSPLSWQIVLLDAINSVFSDVSTDNIVVRSVNTTSVPIIFSWTNDSVPRNQCPRKEIDSLIKILNGNEGLQSKVTMEGLTVGSVSWVGKGPCELKPPPQATNVAPVPRNPVDHLNATVGQLLVYVVPEDTFFDREDGSVRHLKLSLVTIDRKPIPHSHWLQFDVKNQEFYGIPIQTDVGQMEYQLICEDSGGLTTNDGLVVIVYPAAKTLYNVEFSMRLDLEYNNFFESPALQRHFVQKLAGLFGDINTNAIVLSGISPGSTIITWHNKTLPTNICPDDEIRQLRQIMLGDDERVTNLVGRALGPEFPVLGARLTPTGLCQGALTEVTAGGGDLASNDVTAVSHSEQYIIGLIVPSIVIAVMLLCAGLVACFLYRRRRTGKMSVGDEDERQSFRSKGIPVIFQDELDERPEPTNKSPVIMKEEKPPLPPPEYHRGPPLATTALLSDTEDSLYQPPPPFTGSKDSARPKPTPTYRMPPPYVPP